MASINNRVFRTIGSPLILPKHHTCLLRPMVDRSFLIAIDHFTNTYEDVKSIQSRVAEEKVRFARFRPFTFWNRVDRKSTRLNSSYVAISYAVFCLKKKNIHE